MAQISISVGELFERAKEFNVLPQPIKSLYTDKNDIAAEIDLGRFIPNIKMKVSFDSFEEGRAIFKIESPAIVRLPSKFINKNLYEDVVLVKNGNLIIDLNRIIEKKTDKIKVKDIDFSNEIFTIKI